MRKVGRPKGKLNGRIRYFTDAELAAFMKAVADKGPKSKALWTLVYSLALRIGLRAMSLTYFPLPTLSLVRRGKWIWTLGLGNFGLTYVNLKK